ncbi:MAG: hypothetical protein ACYDEY_00515 [Acidimicrobiales bacterium]
MSSRLQALTVGTSIGLIAKPEWPGPFQTHPGGELIKVNEEICEVRPVSPLAEDAPPTGSGLKKGALR